MKKHFRILVPMIAVLSLSLGQTYAAQPTPPQQNEQSWLFLEELIISKPKRSLDAWFGLGGLQVALSVGTGLATYYGAKEVLGNGSRLARFAPYGAGVSISWLQYYTWRNYLLAKKEREQLELAMKLYPQMRERLPHEVWPSTDILHQAWQGDPAQYESLIDDTLSYLKMEVYGRFPDRYKKKNEPLFTSKNSTLRVTLNLYKVFNKAYKVISKLVP